MKDNNTFLISRSALLTYQTCNRKYHLSNEFQGHGLSSTYINRDLLIGSTIHRGLQHLFEHCRVDHPLGDFTESCIDEAVDKAKELFDREVNSNNIGVKKTEDLGYVILESWYISEALIRVYALTRLPLFLEEYEILEVEKEDSLQLSDNIIFLAKADGLLRRKSDNKLVVLSIKTCSEFVEEGSGYKTPTVQTLQIDMQGNSEAYVIKSRLNKLWENFKRNAEMFLVNSSQIEHWLRINEINKEVFDFFMNKFKSGNLEDIKINLVQYEHLVKGETREDPFKSGNYKRQSYLIHPYYYNSGTYSLSQGAFEPSEFKLKIGQGKPPKGWSKVNIWEHMPIKDWVNLLATGEIQPELGPIITENIKASDVIFRSDESQYEWYLTVKSLTEEIKQKQEAFNQTIYNSEDGIGVGIDLTTKLAILYPKDTQQCTKYYGSNCIFYNICHNGLDPQECLNDNLYQIRKPHHKLEEDKFKEKGLI